jgi:hypothetical protein
MRDGGLSETLATTTAAGANGGGIVDAALVVVNAQKDGRCTDGIKVQ